MKDLMKALGWTALSLVIVLAFVWLCEEEVRVYTFEHEVKLDVRRGVLGEYNYATIGGKGDRKIEKKYVDVGMFLKKKGTYTIRYEVRVKGDDYRYRSISVNGEKTGDTMALVMYNFFHTYTMSKEEADKFRFN